MYFSLQWRGDKTDFFFLTSREIINFLMALSCVLAD